MNKKGFTLVELLATIAILSVIMFLAINSYNYVTQNVKNKNYENKITNIKIKALEYAADNNIDSEIISVNKLIELGYLTEETNTNQAYQKIPNPMGGYLDCYNVNIVRDSMDYNIAVEETTNCNQIDIEKIQSQISIIGYNYNNALGDSLGQGDLKWTNQNVLLYLDLSKVELSNNVITWQNGSITKTKEGDIAKFATADQKYSNIYLVDTLVFLNTTIKATVNTKEGPVTIEAKVKIDKEHPTIKAEVSNEWVNGVKTIKLIGGDGAGSGVKAFYITSLESYTPKIEDFIYVASEGLNTKDVKKDVGKYYIYAIDNVNNISNKGEVIISNIDKTGPICLYPIDASNWSKSYTYTYGCSKDSQSGCKTPNQTVTVNQDKASEYIKWEIEDNLGNKTECEAEFLVKVDTTPPVCTNTNNYTTWTNQDRTVTWGCSDSLSGCVETNYGSYSSQNVNSVDSININSYTIQDKAGNTKTCPSKTISVKVDKIAPSCSVSKTHNGWANIANIGSGVLVTGTCSDTGGSGCQTSSINSGYKTANGQYQVSPGTVYDNAGNKADCSSTLVEIDTVKPTCSSSGGTGSTWKNYNITISGTCYDQGSGCVGNTSITYSTDGKYSSASPGTVKDKAGNTTTCPYNQTIWLDKTNPTINVNLSGTKNSSGAYLNSVTRTLKGYDATSGINHYEWSGNCSSKYGDENNSYINSSGYHVYTFTSVGTSSACYRAVDNAGNASSWYGAVTFTVTKEQTFSYTGYTQSYTAPTSGTYRLEAWGAQGGNTNIQDLYAYGGYGGYASGNVWLNAGQTIYITVGGQGTSTYNWSPVQTFSGGYNGGGNCGSYWDSKWGGGGGATSITTVNRGVLSNHNNYRWEVLLVAGGGGGAGIWIYANNKAQGYSVNNGGAGGGTNGYNGYGGYSGDGGTQSSGGAGWHYPNTPATKWVDSGFGYGQNSSDGSGGGGGYYGGGSGIGYGSAAGGGSGYIGGVSSGYMANGQRSGNGYAKITFIG